MFTTMTIWALLGLTPPCLPPTEVKPRPALVISGPVGKTPSYVVFRYRRPSP